MGMAIPTKTKIVNFLNFNIVLLMYYFPKNKRKNFPFPCFHPDNFTLVYFLFVFNFESLYNILIYIAEDKS
jgi:hypothetical protein